MAVGRYQFDLGLESDPTGKHLGLLQFSCQNVEGNAWLTRGLVWCYAFNHEEAIYCFKQCMAVSSIDESDTIMAHWGISMCHGPNYNTASMTRNSFPSAQAAYDHAVKAKQLLDSLSSPDQLSAIETALVDALQVRYNPVPTLKEDDDDYDKPIDQNTSAFAKAMLDVYVRFPDCPCVACLYAESLLNFSPWKLWNLDTGAPHEHTQEAKAVLCKALEQQAPDHPGLNHFKIHLMEMSATPECALPSCEVLRRVCPDAGHLVHMPSHIYVLLGMWQDAVKANKEAHAVDQKYVIKEGISNYYTGYRIHNIHFIAYAAMFAGKSRLVPIITNLAIRIECNVYGTRLN